MTDLAIADAPVLLVVAPLLAALAAFLSPRVAGTVGLAAGALTAGASLLMAARVLREGPLATSLGGWGAPLGIDLHADGLSALLIAMTCCVGFLVGLFVAADPARGRDAAFWPFWLVLLAGLNAIYLSGDVFNIYVALEVIGLAAVGLTVASGRREAVQAGLTYLFAGLVGSLLFLLGVHFLYAGAGRVDLHGLAADPGTAASLALALMLAGLALKTALFPLHFWLPAAHSSATPPASAILSALVLKASLYVALRLWFDVFAPSDALGTLMGALGACAVIYGSVKALGAGRLKLLVAYSTVAQIGMMSLVFALSGGAGAEQAFRGAVYLMLAHGVAKAAMFLAAGRIAAQAGHDRIADLGNADRGPTGAQVAFAIAAVSLIGLPPSAGFVGKWLLLEGALVAGDWPWAAVLLGGTGLSAAYLVRVIARFLRSEPGSAPAGHGWSRADAVPLSLAVLSLGLGLGAAWPLDLLAADIPMETAP